MHQISSPIQRVALLASGQGSNFEAIVKACQAGHLPFESTLLICSQEKAQALQRAERLGVPSALFCLKHYDSVTDWDQAMAERLQAEGTDFIVLAGFTRKLGPQVLSSYEGRIINIHPSLLPKYGGQGMYGRFVHEAVWAAGDKETGISVHIVTADYDEGPVVAQKRIQLEPGDNAEAIAARVRAEEHEFYVEVLRALALSAKGSQSPD